MRFLLIVLLVVGCGKRPESSSPGIYARERSDSLLKPFLDSFMAKAECFDVPMEYTSLRLSINWEGMDVAGLCTQYSDGSAVISIDGPTWISINDVNRERLVYHELGHCALDLDHIDQSLEPGLMTPILYENTYWDYIDDYDYIIKELFFNAPTDCEFAYEAYTSE
mgnify:CR=1 FL=1